MNLLLGDCVEQMKLLPENSVDSVVTDPPYELGFMGKHWDNSGIAYNKEMWKEVLRVTKPGGQLLSFGGTRTYHRMAVAIEDAGFEIRDQLQWLYGSGFPKSFNISKGIDKRGGKSVGWFGSWLKEWRIKNNINQKEISKLFPSKTGGLTGCVANWELGLNLPTAEQFSLIVKTFNLPFESIEEAEREVVGKDRNWGNKGTVPLTGYKEFDVTVSATDEAKVFEGWGSGLKPMNEPIVLARKPLSEKTIVENCLKWGVGGLNIDASRIGNDVHKVNINDFSNQHGNKFGNGESIAKLGEREVQGRFPGNVLLDEEAVQMLDEQSGITKGDSRKEKSTYNKGIWGNAKPVMSNALYNDVGGASRFFYVAKASKSERNEGLSEDKRNFHCTVKPIKLMEYLVRLVTPKNGIVLDPFMGSGSTGVACRNLGFGFVGIEKEKEYFDIAKARINSQATLKELV